MLFAYTRPMPTPLPAKRRSELRAEAHKLAPIVIIGDKGLTDEVMAEIERSLRAHELIKVRAATDERAARGAWLDQICAKLEAHPVQRIGKVLVIYRENREKTEARKLAARIAARIAAGPAAKKDPVKRTSRPRSRTPSPRPESEPRRRRPRSSR